MRTGADKVGLAPMTIKNYLVSLKTALAWAVGQKLLPALPNFPRIKMPKKKPQPIPAESFERLLAGQGTRRPLVGVSALRLVGRAAAV